MRVLEEFIAAGIDSIKVEGRMKSHLYAATMAKVYSQALDYYEEHGHFLSEKLLEWEDELKKVTHRTYAQANLIDKANADTIFNEREHDTELDYVMVGRVIGQIEDKETVIEVRNAFNQYDEVEILPFKGSVLKQGLNHIKLLNGQEIERSKPSTLVKIPYVCGAEVNNIVRMRKV